MGKSPAWHGIADSQLIVEKTKSEGREGHVTSLNYFVFHQNISQEQLHGTQEGLYFLHRLKNKQTINKKKHLMMYRGVAKRGINRRHLHHSITTGLRGDAPTRFSSKAQIK